MGQVGSENGTDTHTPEDFKLGEFHRNAVRSTF